MSLTSFIFFAFCFITLTIYFIVPKRFQMYVLLIASLIFLFYDNLHIETIFQALIVLLSSYINGILIEKYYNTKKAKKILIIRNINNIGTTYIFKIHEHFYIANK